LPIGLAGVIIILTVLRFFILLDKIAVRSKAEAQSKIQALQSRIQPHFLFNSLNTIAELTAIDPTKAEKAIHALSMLFRVGLEEGNPIHSLEKELNLCKRYQELEEFRLGDRATIMWIVEVESPDKWQIPKLILQPLLENAIKYSAQTGDKNNSSYVIVEIKETDKHLSILIENSVANQDEQVTGNGMAIENIQERLFVLYDDQFSFKVRNQDKLYRVIMRIPK
jgi:two-component system sensor histidine kinase AlgZ